jgi:hypothetical protein
MKEFVLIFRMDILTPEAQPTAEQMKEYMKDWMEWINDISNQGQLAEGGNHLSDSGTVIRSNNRVVSEPYIVNNESISGYLLIQVNDMNDAIRMAQKCPILQGEGTSVEIRETATPGNIK